MNPTRVIARGSRAIVSLGARLLAILTRDAAAEARLLEDAARQAGVAGIEPITGGGLGGWASGLRVELTRAQKSGINDTRVTIHGRGISPELTLRREGVDTAWRRMRGLRELEVGDETFDRAVWVEGPPALLRAVLDSDTRRAVRMLFAGALERPKFTPFCCSQTRIEKGVLQVALPDAMRINDLEIVDTLNAFTEGLSVANPLHLPEALQAVLDLARRLVSPRDVAERIATNLRREPVAPVRRLCLTTLLREFPAHPATRAALLAARDDPDAEVRLLAASALGDDGREILLRLAFGEGADDVTTAKAVEALAQRLSTAEAQEILTRALRTRRGETARVAMGVLAFRCGAEGIQRVAKVMTVEPGALAEAAASTLGLAGNPLAEAPLLEALARPSEDLRVAVMRALAKIGTVAAVAPLHELEARGTRLQAEVRRTVAAIQARLGGAAVGQLSLADAQPGRLSIAGENGGELSFAGDGPASAARERVGHGD